MRYRCILISALLLALALNICACGVEVHVPADSLTVTDHMGRQVDVPRQPQRVAALIGSFAQVWQLAGGRLCAAPEDAWEDFGLESDEVVNLGGAHSPGLEALLSSQPQLVIASASTAADLELEQPLTQLNIPVLYFDVDNFEDYLDMLRICTQITGRNDLYEQNGLALRARIQQLKDELAAADIPEQHRRVLLLRASSGSVKAKSSRGTVLGEMLADIGCINIADSDSTLLERLSVESIIEAQPYRIFVVTMGSDTRAALDNLSRMLYEDGAWSALEAVREQRVHIMDKKLFNLKPNHRWAEAYEQLCNIFMQ